MQERQGKGFAVVADEIRVLAEQSKAAVVHIQDVTKNVVESVTNLADGAKKLLEFVGTDVVDSFADSPIWRIPTAMMQEVLMHW